MLKHYKLRNYDFRLVIYVTVLTIVGILVIGSAKSSVQGKQILGLVLGLIVMTVVSLMDFCCVSVGFSILSIWHC